MSAWIICGVAGSGKSTLAQALASATGRECLDADDFHPESNLKKMKSGGALNEADREPWLAAIEVALRSRRGKQLILAFPGLKRAHRERILTAAESPRLLFLRADPALAAARLGARGGFFPAGLVPSQFEILDEPSDGILFDASLEAGELCSRALARLQPGQVGVVGLGRMGGGMAGRLLKEGFEVVGCDPAGCPLGVQSVADLPALIPALAAPRRILVSLPAGEVGRAALDTILPLLSPGDLVLDAANAPWRDAVAAASRLAEKGIEFVDAGVSGGVLGAEAGYSVMAGGSDKAIILARPILEALAQKDGFVHCGPAGSGHFSKTVHNGIEYGMMQSIAEGFELLKKSGEFKLPLAEIARAWSHGAVVKSELVRLTGEALSDDAELSDFDGKVGQNGTGLWAAAEAVQRGVETPALDAALKARQASLSKPSFASKLLSALRMRFGGHRERP